MSSVSRWVYTNIATVWKRGKKDHLNGGTAWGEPFTIACTWTAGTRVATDNNGKEFVSTCEYFHEDYRVGHGDRIAKGLHTSLTPMSVVGADEIKAHTNWDMSFFGEPDSPDYRSIT